MVAAHVNGRSPLGEAVAAQIAIKMEPTISHGGKRAYQRASFDIG